MCVRENSRTSSDWSCCENVQGRTVVTTIHQPNSSITRCFDDLLLLAHGNIIYMGKWAKSVEYFQSVGYQ